MFEYIDSRVILAIPSNLWFEFSTQWLKELKNVQLHMLKHQLLNFGTFTSLSMHIIHSMAHTHSGSETPWWIPSMGW
jgi:hypothetical protein